jgi:energy-coupling factor transport system permease protein
MNRDFFLPGGSFLHRFDPRAKLIVLLSGVVFLFLPNTVFPSFLLTLALAALIAGSLGAKELQKPITALLPILFFIVILTPLFRRGGSPLIVIGGVRILATEALRDIVSLSIRFLCITLLFYAVFRSTDPDGLVLALRASGLPYGAALMLIIALRTIPSLSAAYRDVTDAHKLRRAGAGREDRGSRAIVPVLTSVLIHAIKGIPLLAMALESRGYGRRGRRTSYAVLKSGRPLALDLAVAALIVAVLILCLLLPPTDLFFQ